MSILFAFIKYSVLSKEMVQKTIFETAEIVIEQNTRRVATGVLNEIMMQAVSLQQPPSDKGKRLKLYYIIFLLVI